MMALYRAEDRSRNDFVSSGWYVDELKRTADGWRYYRRRAEVDLELSEVLQKMGITEAFEALAKD